MLSKSRKLSSMDEAAVGIIEASKERPESDVARTTSSCEGKCKHELNSDESKGEPEKSSEPRSPSDGSLSFSIGEVCRRASRKAMRIYALCIHTDIITLEYSVDSES